MRERAAEAVPGTAVILYDVDAAGLFSSPVPTDWSAEGEEDCVGDRLGPRELEAQGRGAIAEQVRYLRAKGIDATGWLPQSANTDDLIRYATSQHADLVLVPADWDMSRVDGSGSPPVERVGGDVAREATESDGAATPR